MNDWLPNRELILAIHMKSTDNTHQAVDDSVAEESGTVHHAVPMTSFETICETRTERGPDFVDVTDQLNEAITESGIARGRVTVFAQDPQCTLVVNERESGLMADLTRTIERLDPNGNIRLGSSSVVLPVDSGRLQLGRWQRVLLVELGDASQRCVTVQVIGER